VKEVDEKSEEMNEIIAKVTKKINSEQTNLKQTSAIMRT
jgi:hypothetical protein